MSEENNLWITEAQCRSLVQNASAMIYRMSLPDGRYEYVSPASTEISGFSPEEWINIPFLIREHIHPDFVEYFHARWHRLLLGETEPAYQYKFIHKSGSIRWFHQTNSIIRNGSGDPVAVEGIVTDITERKQIEDDLKKSEVKYRTLFENMLEGFACCHMFYDKAGDPEDFIYLVVNPAFDRIIGVETVTGKRVTEVFPGIKEDYPELFEIYGRVARTGEPESFDINFNPSAKWLHISVYSPENEYFVAVFSDITERKLKEEELLEKNTELEAAYEEIQTAEEELRENYEILNKNQQELFHSEEKYRNLIETAQEGISVVSPNGKYIFLNQRMAEMLGYERDEIIGRNDLDFIDTYEKSQVLQAHSDLKDGKNFHREFKFRRKTGDALWTLASSSPIYDLNDQHIGNIIMHSDITERKHAEHVSNLTNKIYQIANVTSSLSEMLESYVEEFRVYSGCEAVGIRLLDEKGNIPYQAYSGFPKDFYEKETPLSIKSDECMCIYVIKGTINTDLSVATQRGSFWCNGTSKFLASISDEEKGLTRNVCNQMGYESVALIPIRGLEGIFGLIQFNDHRENMVPLEMIRVIEDVSLPVGETLRRRQAEDALRESESKYRSLVENIPEKIFVKDTSHVYVSCNEHYAHDLGIQPEVIVGKTDFDFYPVDLAKKYQADDREVMESGEIRTIEEQYILDGKQFWVSTIKTPLRNNSGIIIGILGVFHDITEKKRLDEQLKQFNEELERQVAERTEQLNNSLHEKEILLKEIHHRVKNNMQVVSGLLILQSQTAKDEATRLLLRESQERIRSISLVHEQLYRSDNFSQIEYSEYLKKMFSHLFDTYKVDTSKIAIVIDVLPVMISIEKAIPCSLMVNELLSNSFKHAFPDDRRGNIWIKFFLDSESESYVLDYRDDGIGFPETFVMEETGTLGMSLLFGLTRQLDGTMRREEENGVHFTITFPSKELRKGYC